jgi:carbamoylphosphate synthase small subunit
MEGQLSLIHPVNGNIFATFIGTLFGDTSRHDTVVGEVVFQTGQVG